MPDNAVVTGTDSAGAQALQSAPAEQVLALNDERQNIFARRNLALEESWKYLTEATKVLILATFAIYSVGFLIWHCFLGQYGITPHGFLRTEFLSAAICYILLVAAFALPGAMLLDFPSKIITAKTRNAIGIVWTAVLFRVGEIYFPDRDSGSLFWLLEIAGLAAIHLLAVNGLRRFIPPKVLPVVKNEYWMTAYFFTIAAATILVNQRSNPFFLIGTVLFVPTAKYIYGTSVASLWKDNPLGVRVFIVLVLLLLFLAHINNFAINQFGDISREIGGGKPEKAYFKFKPSDDNLAKFFEISETKNGDGPVFILVHSEGEVIFLPSVGNGQNVSARLVRFDQLAGIRYERKP